MRRVRTLQRRQRGIEFHDPVAEPPRDRQPGAVRARLRNRKAARREHDRTSRKHGAVGRRRGERPGRDVDDAGTAKYPDSRTLRLGGQRVADVARPVGRREELARFDLDRERHVELVLEESPDGFEAPCLEHARRGAGVLRDEPLRLEPGGEHVAAPAARNQDLAAGLGRRFEERDGRARPTGEDGRDDTGGAGADDEHVTGAGRNASVYLFPDFREPAALGALEALAGTAWPAGRPSRAGAAGSAGRSRSRRRRRHVDDGRCPR
jgi:hypothetical protein